MLTITVKNPTHSFDLLEKLTHEKSNKAVKILTQDVYDNAKRGASKHIITGKMESNIRQRVKGDAGLVWIDDKNMLVDWKNRKINYAMFVIFGSKPHIIEPKDKKALRFGNFIFAKKVNHTGYKGDNFMQNALKETFNNMENLINGI